MVQVASLGDLCPGLIVSWRVSLMITRRLKCIVLSLELEQKIREQELLSQLMKQLPFLLFYSPGIRSIRLGTKAMKAERTLLNS